MTPKPRRPSGNLLRLAISLELDGIAGEVVAALREAGVASLLLKGPAVAARLYDDATLRTYCDVDLLVPPEAADQAERVLDALGYRFPLREGSAEETSGAAHMWLREGSHGGVDLHRSLWLTEAPPATVWQALSRETGSLELGGVRVDVPSDPALALILALHAVQHGPAERGPGVDLERAVARIPRSAWAAACELADETGSRTELAAALGMLPAGRALAAELGLAPEPSRELALRSLADPGPAESFAQLSKLPGAMTKLRFALGKLFPSAAFMRYDSALARRGRPGLALSYPLRWLSMLRRAPRGLRDWWSLRGRRSLG